MITTFSEYKSARTTNDTAKASLLLKALIVQATPLVKRLARKHERGDYDDLVQVGLMALVEVFEIYDPSRCPFTAFAKMRILTAMERQVIIQRPQVPPAAGRWSRMPSAVRRAAEAFIARTGRQATAVELGVDAASLEAWRSAGGFESYEERDEGPVVAESRDADRDAVLAMALAKAMATLTDEERRVFSAMLDEEATAVSVGAENGLERRAVVRRYESALAKLRSHLAR